ncbi:YwhD family protein [Pelagirhabdus alkalitolerans]|uniref:YwhD family protein n=1 Tax=Pelagirhabdus alkalitolerans TaxID=1612202 RepID=A0A1G6GKD5_9BACI|nr:YwhD family protein [Pelagirhabdus alkalitolerans]SDB81636.1 YwhD family protein [Pelagirhabdus alkalitolerans]
MMNEQNKSQQFTIMKDDATDGHGGYGVGSISLENISPVIIDPNEKRAFVDMGAMHARSEIERRVKFIKDEDEVPNGLTYWIAWVTVEANENGPYYHGVCASRLLIDRPNKRAFKSMPEHVTDMEKSMKGKMRVDHLDETSKTLLGDFLKSHNEDMFNNSEAELKTLFT